MKRILLAFLLISSVAHGQNAFKGVNTSLLKIDYESNIGSTFGARSLIDKGYADSAITAGSRAAISLTTTGTGGAATYTGATGVFNIPVYAKPTLTKNMTLESPTSSENFELLETPVAITITNVKVVLVGTGSPSVTYNLAFDADRSVAGTNVFTAGQTVTSTTTGTAASSGFNDATVPAGSYIRLTTSALTDATRLQIRITYTED